MTGLKQQGRLYLEAVVGAARESARENFRKRLISALLCSVLESIGVLSPLVFGEIQNFLG